MAKKLTKIRIDEVSAVDSGAGRCVRVVLMKRNGKKPRYVMNDSFNLVPIDKVDTDGDSTARALAEIAANRAAGFVPKSFNSIPGHQFRKEEKMQTDIIKTMDERLAEIRKADPSIRSDQHALLKLAESRNPGDFELFQSYKNGVALSSSVEKSVKVKKTLRNMGARIDEIMAADPGCRSRESAIAKVASSRLESDQALWRDYRVASQQVDQVVLREDVVPVGKSMADLAMQNMVGAIMASYPHLSVEAARRWAEKIMRGAPPAAALTQRTRDAA
jgi:hypothetical protein